MVVKDSEIANSVSSSLSLFQSPCGEMVVKVIGKDGNDKLIGEGEVSVPLRGNGRESENFSG